MATVADRVAAGAAWLDDHVPGWAEMVDLGRLDLLESTCCVLGQVFADPTCYRAGYDWALERHFADDDGYAVRLGFDAARERYDTLTREWCHLIAQRQAVRHG